MRLNLPGPSSASAPFTTAQGGVADLNALRSTERNQTGGFPTLDEDGFVQDIHVSTSQSDTPVMLIGPTYGVKDETLTYKISNYNSWRTYTVTTSNGTISQSGDTITLTPLIDSTQIVTMTVNERNFPVLMHGKEISPPILTIDNKGWIVDLEGSAFQVQYSADTHVASQWQIATDPNFFQIVKDSGESANKLAITFQGFELASNYFARLRYKGSILGWSLWSGVKTFTSPASASVRKPSVISHPSDRVLSTIDPQTFISSELIVDSSTLAWSATLLSVEWQLWRDSSMTSLIAARTTPSTVLTMTNAELGLGFGDTFYVRCRQEGSGLALSDWSDLRSLRFGGEISKPVLSPTYAVTRTYSQTFVGSAFTSTNGYAKQKSLWQFADNPAFTGAEEIVVNGTGTSTSRSWATNGVYYVRVKYYDVSGISSFWSDAAKITVTPIPYSLSSNVGGTFITGTAFNGWRNYLQVYANYAEAGDSAGAYPVTFTWTITLDGAVIGGGSTSSSLPHEFYGLPTGGYFVVTAEARNSIGGVAVGGMQGTVPPYVTAP